MRSPEFWAEMEKLDIQCLFDRGPAATADRGSSANEEGPHATFK
jgi:hypothetical protein